MFATILRIKEQLITFTFKVAVIILDSLMYNYGNYVTQ